MQRGIDLGNDVQGEKHPGTFEIILNLSENPMIGDS